MQSRGTLEPDEDVLEDGIAFAGVSKYPARVKCALLGWMAWKDATAQATAQRTADDEETPHERGSADPHRGRRAQGATPSRTTSSRR